MLCNVLLAILVMRSNVCNPCHALKCVATQKSGWVRHYMFGQLCKTLVNSEMLRFQRIIEDAMRRIITAPPTPLAIKKKIYSQFEHHFLAELESSWVFFLTNAWVFST